MRPLPIAGRVAPLRWKRDRVRGTTVPQLHIYPNDLRAAGLERYPRIGMRIVAGRPMLCPPADATETCSRTFTRHPRHYDLRISGRWFAEILGPAATVRLTPHRRAQLLEITAESFFEEKQEIA